MIKHRSFRLTAWRDECCGQPSPDSPARHSHAIVVAITQQTPLFVLAALLLDGGYALRFCAIAAVVSWVATLLIMLRRPRHPTNVDLAIVTYGFWPAMALTLLGGLIVNAVSR